MKSTMRARSEAPGAFFGDLKVQSAAKGDDAEPGDAETQETGIVVIVKPQAMSGEVVEDDSEETLVKRTSKSKQEREKGFKPSQYKTRLCRR
eukprot:scaffold158828_cov32-Tisochrysis_lutea.AAC.12